MEHTVQAYLERRSTVELVSFLQMCAYQNQWQQYTQTVPLVFEALQNRKATPPAQIVHSWHTFLAGQKENM